ncbi:aminomethyl transferase family protein [Brevibacterium sp. UCMA 11752]|uniref:aminomethyl transferase family protein n=1 Tax=Brevibacterium sp. UCMA 11752 TaxID=2745946 RepID=UPI001F29DF16|nr:aminomethyl transferase family protein [Brevibacterium sp. UCMA 11752]MCF2585802.1 aminomethyl transferase family protein [Brevibacterium sp. UCMA 11752]
MTESLAEAIQRAGGAISLLRNAQAKPTIFPVQPEFTNWRSEQKSWRNSVALLDQSHHMSDLFIKGPDALKLLSDVAVNSFEKFTPNKAKQFIAVNHEGYLIGDAILFYLEEQSFDLVGWHMVLDWLQYHGEIGGYDVTFERDASSAVRTGDPIQYRYEVQGPRALELMESATGCEVPQTRFFGMTDFVIDGLRVRSLRHGMAGQPGFELFGPWSEGERIRSALVKAGEGLDLVLVGSKAYSSSNLESAWVPSPFPAIFSGEGTEGYREWLPADRAGSLAGSFDSDRVEDFYLTPFDLGYGRSVKFDHEFIGKAALQRLAEEPPRQKVTLLWEPSDVAAAIQTQFEPGVPAKYIDFPKSRYGQYQVDRVLVDGKEVGISHDPGYITNEQAFVSLASIDNEFAELGTKVTVVWGEDPVSAKPAVEAHRQVNIRATVESAPYSAFARENYRKD